MVHQTPIRPAWLPLLLLAALFAAPGSYAATATVELTGPAGAEVFLDGEAIGFLPLSQPLELDRGQYVLRCELPGYQPYEVPLQITSPEDSKKIQARLIPLSQRTAWASNLIFAGLGQHYTGQNLRGWTYNALEVGGLITALVAELERSNYRKDYLLLMEKYDLQINADRIEDYRQKALATYADMEDMEKLRKTGLLVAGGAVLLSILDSVLFYPSFEAGMGSPTALNGSAAEAPQQAWNTVHLGYRATF